MGILKCIRQKFWRIIMYFNLQVKMEQGQQMFRTVVLWIQITDDLCYVSGKTGMWSWISDQCVVGYYNVSFSSNFRWFHFYFRTGQIFVFLLVSIFLVIFFLTGDFNSAIRVAVSGRTPQFYLCSESMHLASGANNSSRDSDNL